MSDFPEISKFNDLLTRIRSVDHATFDHLALEIYRYQAKYNPTFHEYHQLLKVRPEDCKCVEQIKFLPISFFKSRIVKTGTWNTSEIFRSSGTSGQISSQHHVHSLPWYHDLSLSIFQQRFGQLDDFEIFALLPGYLERKDASLVRMVHHFMQSTGNPGGFFLDDFPKLEAALLNSLTKNKKTVLFGVTHALLDFAAESKTNFRDLIVIETGGMKGKGQEITREALHQTLKQRLGAQSIHSEYGMTEMLSQAYTKDVGLFEEVLSLKILIADINDPFEIIDHHKSGRIQCIDLANIHTCAFISTDDIGRKQGDHSFEVLGRIDGSELRGCNLLYEAHQ